LFAGVFAGTYLSLLHQLINQLKYHSRASEVYGFTVFSVTLYACRCPYFAIPIQIMH